MSDNDVYCDWCAAETERECACDYRPFLARPEKPATGCGADFLALGVPCDGERNVCPSCWLRTATAEQRLARIVETVDAFGTEGEAILHFGAMSYDELVRRTLDNIRRLAAGAEPDERDLCAAFAHDWAVRYDRTRPIGRYCRTCGEFQREPARADAATPDQHRLTP